MGNKINERKLSRQLTVTIDRDELDVLEGKDSAVINHFRDCFNLNELDLCHLRSINVSSEKHLISFGYRIELDNHHEICDVFFSRPLHTSDEDKYGNKERLEKIKKQVLMYYGHELIISYE